MPINRRQFLGGMTTGGALLAGASLLEIERAWAQQKAAGEKGAARPNFVFILTDDQRKGAMGNDGNRLVATPHLDRLAREGIWKLIRYRGVEGADELYHLRDDPREIKNLIREPGAQAELRKMQAELERLLAQTSTQKPAVTEPTA